MEARQFALRCIAPYVRRGDTLESLQRSYFGCSGPEGSLQIGGYVRRRPVPIKLTVERIATRLAPGKLAVTGLGGGECLYVFDLKALYAESRRRFEQGSLF